jgi:HSP20 family protein
MVNELTQRSASFYRGTDPIAAMQEQALRVFQQMLAVNQRQEGGQNNIIPLAEALEDDSAYVIRLEIPGIDPKDTDVSVVGSTLTVKAERRREAQQGQGQQQQGQQGKGKEQDQGQRGRHLLFSEIPNGVIRREFGLPEDADRQNINAEFRNGLLTLTIPKSQETHQRRRIEVKGN